ncbi:MAG: galactokinase [Desulfobacterales bacterium]
MNLRDILEKEEIATSAPNRIDMGGTLDIGTFFYPLRHHVPCTFNIAINLRTKVSLSPFQADMVKISSKGFKSATYRLEQAPFDHPLGLMFAIASYFKAEGIHIDIATSSPPKSALGGSSTAAVALIAAFSEVYKKMGDLSLPRSKIALLAHAVEQSVAGIPCGIQDQLAAVYGGVNAWLWNGEVKGSFYKRKIVIKKRYHNDFAQHLLLAYCGIPHESKQINNRWIKQFVSGTDRDYWYQIIECAKVFVKSLSDGNYEAASMSMNRETELRQKMTPEVLDNMGKKLVDAALKHQCGARFTGAGGGGCIWALGEKMAIDGLRSDWEKILESRKDARLLRIKIDSQGVIKEK